jgi:hypothetical protein
MKYTNVWLKKKNEEVTSFRRSVPLIVQLYPQLFKQYEENVNLEKSQELKK